MPGDGEPGAGGAPHTDVTAEVRGDVCVVRCSGDGEGLAAELYDALERCHAAGARDVVVDLELRHALDRGSVGVLRRCAAEFREDGGELVVACEEPTLKASLTEAGLGSSSGAEAGPTLEGIDLMRLPASPRWHHVFTFPAARHELPNARRHVVALAEICGLEGAPLFELTVAVGEALANAVVHGSPRGDEDEVEVHFYCYDRAVAVEVSDHGRGLDSTPIRAPAVTAGAGRGIHFMRALTDDLLLNADDLGTKVLLLKQLPRRDAA